jgi:pyrroline-5-carboxylate reductase
MSTIVFLGGGRITSAMLAGLRLKKSKHRFVVHDRNADKLRDLSKRYAVTAEPDLKNAVQQADVLIVAVRPSSVSELLHSIGKFPRPLLAVSLAAGVPFRVLTQTLGSPVRWARAMPSPVCRSGRGLTGVTFPRTFPRRDRLRVIDLFASFGQVIEIPENKFDAFTVTYSCSHGYHALAALAKAGQAAGLDRRRALIASAHALADGVIAWREGKRSLESLLEEAATPSGIAATTMAAMDAEGYRKAIGKGVLAGLRRARANRRQ